MRIAIFSEAGFEYGFGHFYRMSGICDKAQREGLDVTMYLMADEAARANLDRDYVKFVDWQDPSFYKQELTKEVLLVIDSYHVDIRMLETFKALAGEMIVIDDNIRLNYHDMKILNPNYFALFLDYPKDRNNTLYLGSDYTLLRDEFTSAERNPVKEDVSDILITMGGTDPLGKTGQIIDAIRQVSETVRLHVVCTKAYHDLDGIRAKLLNTDRLYFNIDAGTMCELMKECDFAVASAGQTTNELIKMQCPAVLVVVADNQVLNTRYLSEAGYIIGMYDNDSSLIREMFSYEKRKMLAEMLNTFRSDSSGKELICELARCGGVDGK